MASSNLERLVKDATLVSLKAPLTQLNKSQAHSLLSKDTSLGCKRLDSLPQRPGHRGYVLSLLS